MERASSVFRPPPRPGLPSAPPRLPPSLLAGRRSCPLRRLSCPSPSLSSGVAVWRWARPQRAPRRLGFGPRHPLTVLVSQCPGLPFTHVFPRLGRRKKVREKEKRGEKQLCTHYMRVRKNTCLQSRADSCTVGRRASPHPRSTQTFLATKQLSNAQEGPSIFARHEGPCKTIKPNILARREGPCSTQLDVNTCSGAMRRFRATWPSKEMMKKCYSRRCRCLPTLCKTP